MCIYTHSAHVYNVLTSGLGAMAERVKGSAQLPTLISLMRISARSRARLFTQQFRKGDDGKSSIHDLELITAPSEGDTFPPLLLLKGTGFGC